MSAYAIDVTEEGFLEQVIETSRRVPVIMDFWAEWCGPCRVLKPVLEKLAAEYQGRFILAKVDSDEHPGLAGRYAVRGIPTVVAVVNGEEVERFSGAQPESQVRQFLARVMPSRALRHRDEAVALVAQGRASAAFELLEKALDTEPDNDELRVTLARLQWDSGLHDEARKNIERLSPAGCLGDEATTLLARMELAEKVRALPGEKALEARIASAPEDLGARLDYASLMASRGDYIAALDQLLEIVRHDRTFQDDVGRKTMLRMFQMIQGQDDLVSRYRKLLSAALH